MTLRTQLLLARIKEKISSGLMLLKKIITPKNKVMFWGVFLIFIIAFTVFGFFASANILDGVSSVGDLILKAISYALYALAYALGWLAMKIFAAIVMVSGYNEFVTSPAVTKGWVLIRDVCNMLIVIFLLVFAFGTILRLKSFSDNKILSKLLLAAVLVNFSKLFCGIMIDLGQVFMLTFVNGYKASAGANLINGLHLGQVLEFDNKVDANVDWVNIVVMLIFAIIFLIATLIIIIYILGYLLLRIVVLWILVVLSPLGFLSSVQIPKLSQYTSMWWDKFFNFLLIGPVLAFFLWLSLLVMSDSTNIDVGGKFSAALTEANNAQVEKTETPELALTQLDNFVVALIGLSMLYGAMWAARSITGISSSALKGMASKGLGYAKYVPGVGEASRKISAYRSLSKSSRDAVRNQRAQDFAQRMQLQKEKTIGAVKKGAMSVVAPVSGAMGAVKGFGTGIVAAAKAPKGEGWKAFKGEVAAKSKQGLMAPIRSAGSIEMAAARGREKTLIDNAKTRLNQQNLSDEQLAERAKSGANKYEKRAAVEMLVAKDAFDEQVKGNDVKKVLTDVTKGFSADSNKGLDDVLKDNYANFLYDLKSESGRAEFVKAVQSGTIDYSKQKEGFWNDKDAVALAMRHDEKNFTKALEDKAKNKSVKDREVATNTLSTILFDTKVMKTEKGKETEEDKEETGKLQQKARETYANITSNIDQAFTITNQDGGSEINVDLVKNYVEKSMKPQVLENVKVSDGKLKLDDKVKQAMFESMPLSKLKTLAKKDSDKALTLLEALKEKFDKSDNKDHQARFAEQLKAVAKDSNFQTAEFREIIEDVENKMTSTKPG